MKSKQSRHAQLFMLMACLIGTNNAAAHDGVLHDVVYGVISGVSLTMDVYQPTESNHRGIILVPGSGWDEPDRGFTNHQLKSGIPYLNDLRDSMRQAGFTVFVANHRMAPLFKYPDAILDIQRAVRFVRHNASRFDIEPFPLGATGHSSGGHLVAMAGVLDDDEELQNSRYPEEHESSRVQAVVTIAAPQDMTVNVGILWPFTVGFMGERPAMDEDYNEYLREGIYAEASTITHVTPDDASFLLIHGTSDMWVPPEQLSIMSDALSAAGVSYEAMSVEVDSHSPPLDHAAIIAWLENQLL